jgi:hypothetical protein
VCHFILQMKWVEPMSAFLLYFGRSVSPCLLLDDFFCSSLESQEMERKLRSAKKDGGTSEHSGDSWEHLLNDSAKMHLQIFRETGFDQNRIWDLDHNPLKRPRTSRKGGIMQTLTSHGTLWNECLGRPLTALETALSCLHVHLCICVFVSICIDAVKS